MGLQREAAQKVPVSGDGNASLARLTLIGPYIDPEDRMHKSAGWWFSAMLVTLAFLGTAHAQPKSRGSVAGAQASRSTGAVEARRTQAAGVYKREPTTVRGKARGLTTSRSGSRAAVRVKR